ncbi:hypothetical protein RDI58_018805 [Solanum bulbocastanum]|uniref:Uncharacterized protein n=1 Tax=Solanum bulbocastanum TaxID=147425 RepID=A0AAN8YA30_SOLBU
MAAGSGARGLRERNIVGLADTGRAVLEGDQGKKSRRCGNRLWSRWI